MSTPGSLRIVLPEAYHLGVTTDGEGRILYERISNVLSCSSRTSNVHRGHQVAKGKDRKSLGVELVQSYRRAKDDLLNREAQLSVLPPELGDHSLSEEGVQTAGGHQRQQRCPNQSLNHIRVCRSELFERLARCEFAEQRSTSHLIESGLATSSVVSGPRARGS